MGFVTTGLGAQTWDQVLLAVQNTSGLTQSDLQIQAAQVQVNLTSIPADFQFSVSPAFKMTDETTSFTASLGASFPLGLTAEAGDRQTAALDSLTQVEFRNQTARDTALDQVLSAHEQYYLAIADLEVTENELENLEQRLALAQARLERGELSLYEYSQVEGEFLAGQLDVLDARMAATFARQDLNVVSPDLARSLAAKPAALDERYTLAPPSQWNENFPQVVVEHPIYKATQVNLDRITGPQSESTFADISLALRTSVITEGHTVNAGYSFDSTVLSLGYTPPGLPLTPVSASTPDWTWNLSADLSLVPTRNREAVDQFTSQEIDQVIFDLEQARLTVVRGLQRSFTQMERAAEALAGARDSNNRTSLLLETLQIRRDLGLLGDLDYAEALTTLERSNLTLEKAKIEYHRAVRNYYLAAGNLYSKLNANFEQGENKE